MIPGFVDSHSHLVFAGDRSAEFAARMAGESYAAGGIRTTVAATRAATDEQLTSHVAHLVAEMRRQGTTTVEIKSGYGLSVHDEARSLAVARQFTEETTFLGAHVVPEGTTPGGVRRARHRADAPGVRTSRALDRRVLRERGLRRRPEPRGPRGGSRGGAARPAPRQPARPGTRRTPGLRAGADRRRPLHLPHRRRRRRPRRSPGTIATLLPGVEFSTRQPYPDVRRLLDAGVRVAIASDCNPGSCFTSSMPLCVALAVREMGMTPAEAVYAATAGGAAALDRDDVGVLTPGEAGRPGAPRRPHPRPPRLPSRGAARGGDLGRPDDPSDGPSGAIAPLPREPARPRLRLASEVAIYWAGCRF